MKNHKITVLLPIIMMLNGCAAWVSSEHRHDHRSGSHSHNRVSVGVHSHGSGKGALGALIVGGIIGAVINQASHESKEKEQEKKEIKQKELEQKKLEELQRAEQSQSEQVQAKEDMSRINNSSQATKWYQVGKDGNCYQMQTKSGVTDILNSVESKFCD